MGQEAVNPDSITRTAIETISAALEDRSSPLRWPVFSSTRPDGGVASRILVLREVHKGEGTPVQCVFHTDPRSAKIDELRVDNRVSLLFFDRETMVQTRFGGRALVHHGDEVAGRAFAALSEDAKASYQSAIAPGSVIAQPGDATGANADEHHFAVIAVTVDRMDVLDISKDPHQRVQAHWDGSDYESVFVAP
jgi:3-hydroxyisobutyrate dehydrogenase